MMPITPSGTRTREILSPFGRSHDAIVWPIGSSSAATTSRPAAVASIRFSLSASRSIIALDKPALFASATSSAFARSTVFASARSSFAAASSAARFTAGFASASSAAAARAARPTSNICSRRSGLLAIFTLLIVLSRWRRRRSAAAVLASSRLDQHQVVAVNDLIPAAITQHVGNTGRLLARDQPRLVGRVRDQPARELAAVGAEHAHRVAALELTVHAHHAGR